MAFGRGGMRKGGAARLRVGVAALVLGAVPLLNGCNGFFVCEGKASCPSSSSSSTASGDVVYATNGSAGQQYLNGYSVSGGSLVAATSSPYALGYTPFSMAVRPGNGYLYVASDTAFTGGGEIYGYSIGTGGAITALNSGTALENENSAGIDITPDGNYLFSLNADGLSMEEYSINSSSGLLTYVGTYSTGLVNGNAFVASELKVSPNGNFVAVALGTAGTTVFPLSSGSIGAASLLTTGSATNGAFGIAIDSSNYLYVVTTNGLEVYSVSSSGVPNTSSVNSTPYAVGSPTATSSVALIDLSGKYLYVGSESASGAAEIYGFTGVGTGTLTAMSAPFAGPTGIAALARDSTGDYVIAGGYSATSGLQMFSIGSGGGLTEINNVVNGTNTTVPMVLTATH